jgi:hypothetical protein
VPMPLRCGQDGSTGTPARPGPCLATPRAGVVGELDIPRSDVVLSGCSGGDLIVHPRSQRGRFEGCEAEADGEIRCG